MAIQRNPVSKNNKTTTTTTTTKSKRKIEYYLCSNLRVVGNSLDRANTFGKVSLSIYLSAEREGRERERERCSVGAMPVI